MLKSARHEPTGFVWLVPRVDTPKPSRKNPKPVKVDANTPNVHSPETKRNLPLARQTNTTYNTEVLHRMGNRPVLVTRGGWVPTRHLPENGIPGWPPLPGGSARDNGANDLAVQPTQLSEVPGATVRCHTSDYPQ